MKDDTEYIKSLIERGLKIPGGTYYIGKTIFFGTKEDKRRKKNAKLVKRLIKKINNENIHFIKRCLKDSIC